MRIVMPAAVDPLDAHIAELEESRPPREHPHDGGLRRGHADEVHGRLARRAERGHGESFRRRRGGWDAGKTHCPDTRTLPVRSAGFHRSEFRNATFWKTMRPQPILVESIPACLAPGRRQR